MRLRAGLLFFVLSLLAAPALAQTPTGAVLVADDVFVTNDKQLIA